jgi:hypothetical protein
MKKLLVLLLLSNIVLASEVHLLQTRFDATFQVPVRINDKVTINFTVDSGAIVVQIPVNFVDLLVKNNVIKLSDILFDHKYIQANGTEITNKNIVFKQLQVGDRIAYNVAGTIGAPNSLLLLGQSFFQNFTEWGINNVTHTLILGEPIINH